MRAAPAFTIECPRSRGWAAACALLTASAAASLVAGLCAHAALPSIAAGVAIASSAAVAAVLSWRYSPQASGRLRWDGARWWLRDAASPASEKPGKLMVMIDLGAWMLLRFAPEGGGRRWLPLGGGRPGAGSLRAALYAGAREGLPT